MLCSIGILYILGAIIGNIGPAILSTLIIPPLFTWYRKRKYPSFDLYIKEKYPERYEKMIEKRNTPVSIWTKIGRNILFLFLLMSAIASIILFLK